MFRGFGCGRSLRPNLPSRRTPQPRVARVISPGSPTLVRVISSESPTHGPVPVPTYNEDSPSQQNLARQAPPMLPEMDMRTPPLVRQYSGLSAPSPLHRTISRSTTTSPTGFPVSSYHLSDAPVRPPGRHVGFVGSPTHSVHRSEISVQPYSEVYGIHPRSFNFDRYGDKVPSDRPTPIGPDDVEYAPPSTLYSPQSRPPGSSGYPTGSRPAATSGSGYGYNSSYGGSRYYHQQEEPTDYLFGGPPR